MSTHIPRDPRPRVDAPTHPAVTTAVTKVLLAATVGASLLMMDARAAGQGVTQEGAPLPSPPIAPLWPPVTAVTPPPWGGASLPPPPLPGPNAAATAALPPPPVIVASRRRTDRVLIETGGGAAAGLVLGVAGLYVGFLGGAVSLSDSRARAGTDGFLQAGLYGGIVGASIGIPLGVYLVGNNFRGNGGLGWTYLCSVAGGAAAFGLAVAAQDGNVPVGVPILAGLVLPLAGAVVGYELSSDVDARPRPVPRSTLVPLVSVAPGGSVLGLGGTF